jgi:hypothetical protein
MKKALAAGVALASVALSGGSFAESASDFSGRFGFETGVARLADTDSDGSSRPFIFEGDGALNIPVGDSYSVQLTVDTSSNGRYYSDDGPQGRSQFGVHFNRRNPDSGLLGVFAAAGRGFSAEQDSERANMGSVAGIEAQKYWSSLTLYAQAYYADFRIDDSDIEKVQGIFGSLEGRYFISDETMLSLGLAMGSSEKYIDGDDRGDFTGASLKVKHRISKNNPLYLTGQYRAGKFDATSEGDIAYESTFMIGVQALFGAGTLKQNDRRGATLDVPVLAAQAASWLEQLD